MTTTTLRIYDNGGATADRYTIIPPRWAHRSYMERDGKWACIGSGSRPFHPQDYGQHCTAIPGPHLGKRITWDQLPPDVQKFARQSFPEFLKD